MDSALIQALEAADAHAAIEFVEDEDDPARVLAMYHGAIRHLYWSRKDITTLVAVGAAALRYGAALSDPNHIGLLKSVAYDLGSFCWPGWDEPGIGIDADTQRFGARAADLSLELGLRLERPAAPMANAHWLVGAHRLAAGDRDGAVESFERSALIAEDRASELLALGYVSIARGERVVIDELRSLEHGIELAQQLATAERLFA